VDWLIWLRIGTSGGLLWTRYWTFVFHKMLGSSWVAVQFASPEEGRSSLSLVNVLEDGQPRLRHAVFNIINWLTYRYIRFSNRLCITESACLMTVLRHKYIDTTGWKLKLNSVALGRKRTIPTERPPLVGEVSANFLRAEVVPWSARRIPTTVNLDFLDPEPLLF
jgi:hypothetical protein